MQTPLRLAGESFGTPLQIPEYHENNEKDAEKQLSWNVSRGPENHGHNEKQTEWSSKWRATYSFLFPFRFLRFFLLVGDNFTMFPVAGSRETIA